MKKILLLLLVLAPLVCQARIGETLEECQARYGILLRVEMADQAHQEYPQYCFKLGEVNIRVRLYNGKSAQELFYCDDHDLTRAQVEEIRESNRCEDCIWRHEIRYRSLPEILVVTTKDFDRVFHKEDGKGF